MNRYLFGIAFVGLLLLALGVPALAQDATPAAAADLEPWTCPEGFEGQRLSVYNWSTYIADDTVANFEAACGVDVTYDVYESNESLLSRLREGNPGYDIIVPTDYMIQIMATEGILQLLDHGKIPNLANVSPDLLDSPFDPGNQYSAPYQWGTVGIGYNREQVGEEVTSWEQLFNYDGPVAWLEDLRAMMSTAMVMNGMEPNSSDPAVIATARDYLIEHGRNVVSVAADDGQVQLERGDADMVIEYSGDIFQVIDSCACDTFAYAIPEEGAQLWTDNLAIPAGAPNAELAHVWIDYILDPQVSADIANYTAYGSPNQAAIDLGLIDADLLNDPAIYPPPEVRERLYMNAAITPEAEQLYLDAWDEIRILLGQ